MVEDDGRPGGLTDQFGSRDARTDARPLSLHSDRLAHAPDRFATELRREEVGWSICSSYCQAARPRSRATRQFLFTRRLPIPFRTAPIRTRQFFQAMFRPSRRRHSFRHHQGEAV